jgi:hypothetical protein
LWSSPFTKYEKIVPIFIISLWYPKGIIWKKHTKVPGCFKKMECPLDVPFQ